MARDDEFTALYERYYEAIVRYLMRRFGIDQDDARELAQDAFTRVYTKWEQRRGDGDWSYILVTAARLALNWLRGRRVRPEGQTQVSLDDPDQPEIAASAPPVDEAVLAKLERVERQALFRRALERLKPAPREALTLRLEGLSYAEIGLRLGIPEARVKSRIHEAKEALRRDIGAAPEE